MNLKITSLLLACVLATFLATPVQAVPVLTEEAPISPPDQGTFAQDLVLAAVDHPALSGAISLTTATDVTVLADAHLRIADIEFDCTGEEEAYALRTADLTAQLPAANYASLGECCGGGGWSSPIISQRATNYLVASFALLLIGLGIWRQHRLQRHHRHGVVA